MKPLVSTDITGQIQHLSYLGIFVWFLVTQLIVIMPIAEEVVLLSIGYVSASGVWNPLISGPIAMFTLFLADNIFYFLARSGNRYVRRLTGRSDSKLRQKAESGMKRHMPRTLFGLTFVPRLRFFGPILAGALRVRWWVFLAVDATALFIFVSIYVSLGYVFHNSLARLFKGVEVLQAVLAVATVILVGIIILIVTRRRRKRREAMEAAQKRIPPASAGGIPQ
jgi:membrane-associated protein